MLDDDRNIGMELFQSGQIQFIIQNAETCTGKFYRAGTAKAVEKTNGTLARVRSAMRINYFDDRSIVKEWKKVLSGK